VTLLLWMLLPIVTLTASDIPVNSVAGVASRYSFGVISWGLQNAARTRVQIWPHNAQPYVATEQDRSLVLRYFDLLLAMDEMTATIKDGHSGQLSILRAEANRLEEKVRSILRRQVTQVLHDEGLTENIWAAYDILFPPLEFRMTELPFILVVSPRERIELQETLLLEPSLGQEEMLRIEQGIERLGLSALVERVGGVAVYPSMIHRSSSISYTLSIIAHEWFHQYLFFRPLGRSYWSHPQMVAINESVADIAGNELGAIVYQRYYGSATPGPTVAERGARSSGFDFNKEMRATRLTVDWYLEKGMVDEAERYMEERRLVFVEHGYGIRKINQAYFAFHGSYASDPAAVSPIQQQLITLRARSGSLGEFIRTAAQISRPEDLAELVPLHSQPVPPSFAHSNS
jgi:hypothetical protein